MTIGVAELWQVASFGNFPPRAQVPAAPKLARSPSVFLLRRWSTPSKIVRRLLGRFTNSSFGGDRSISLPRMEGTRSMSITKIVDAVHASPHFDFVPTDPLAQAPQAQAPHYELVPSTESSSLDDDDDRARDVTDWIAPRMDCGSSADGSNDHDVEDVESMTSDSLSLDNTVALDLTGRNFTIDNVGSTSQPHVPYRQMTVVKLRRLCTERGVRLPCNARKEERIRALEQYDLTMPPLLRAMGRNEQADAATPTARRTPGDLLRLINVLFSNRFIERFTRLGDTQSRAQLDGAVSVRMAFWNDVAVEFGINRGEYSHLIAEDTILSGVDMSRIVSHPVLKLQAMWKEVQAEYTKILGRYHVSGNHENAFRNFVHGNIGALYLWHWLQIKPQVSDFVRGGLFTRDEFDSLRDRLHASSESPQSKRRREDGDAPTGPSPRTQRNTRRAKTNQAISSLASSVAAYINNRMSEKGFGAASDKLKALEEYRVAISAVERDIVNATGPEKDRLSEDLAFYKSQRARQIESA